MAEQSGHRTSKSASAIEDTIYVRNLRLAAVFERDAWGRPGKTQPVIICLQLHMDTSQTGNSDDLQHSFSYGQICKDLTSAVDAKAFVDIDRLTNALCETARPWPGQEIRGQFLLPKAFLRVDGGLRKHFGLSKKPHGDWEILEDRWAVEGIKAACIIGVNAHERLEKQTVNVDLTVSRTCLVPASGQRSLLGLSTENWQALVKIVLEIVEVSTFETLEALASLLARRCLHFVPNITVAVEKPSALGMVEASGVTISRARDTEEVLASPVIAHWRGKNGASSASDVFEAFAKSQSTQNSPQSLKYSVLKYSIMPNSLDQLKAIGTTVVCDSGDFATIDKYKPQDATTNPSLILAASKKEEYAKLIDGAVAYGKDHGKDMDEKVDATLDRLLVEFGKEILKIVPGKVSTEVDARFSFDVKGSINKALHIIKLYKDQGIGKERVLIKLASTWEGIKAAQVLQKEHGINCNLTLMFSLPQAIAAAEAGAFLISPFVGRILDWYKASTKKDYAPQDDPGVKSVQAIFNYYKKYGYKTIVMGASFRNVGEITELAGCDYLTISPNLLEDLYNSQDKIPQKLIAEDAKNLDIPKKSYINEESLFRFDFNEETMAVEKLREGISKFAADAITLKGILQKKIESA